MFGDTQWRGRARTFRSLTWTKREIAQAASNLGLPYAQDVMGIGLLEALGRYLAHREAMFSMPLFQLLIPVSPWLA
jgi:hypothetical protein